MLLLTDRQDESRLLRRDLSFIAPCKVVSVDVLAPDAVGEDIFVSDVATDSAARIERFQRAINHYRCKDEPLLCLLRENTYLARTQAFALGATLTLPHNAPRNTILETITGLANPLAPKQSNPTSDIQTGVWRASLALADLLDAAETGAPIEPKTLSAGTDMVLKAVARSDVSNWLDLVGSYDDITYQHSLSVAGLAAAFSMKLGLKHSDQVRLTEAALLHDIGKARIPIEILGKPTALTTAEMTIMQTHAAIGYELLLSQGGFSPELLDVVRHHHEFLNGAGYPDGLKGGQISDMVRLVTICDIYAALIERRSYKQALSPEIAYQILQGMTGKLDRALVAAFYQVVLAHRGQLVAEPGHRVNSGGSRSGKRP